MSGHLTERQQAVLECIQAFVKERGLPPTVREIGERLGLDPHAVHDHLKALERKGYVKRESAKARSIRLLHAVQEGTGRPIPVVGRVQAGLPLLAVENVEGTLPVAEEWLGGSEAFFLKVKGESMVGAHIWDGDYVLVRRQETARDGEIVVALLDEEATIKRLIRRDGVILLQPENPLMAPIEVKEGEERFRILGKVIGVFRKL
ncbi:MAG: repressor LexA [candidate division NC10 bacterium]|nr:repressor LexA [candidate division NC10 bacterium]